MDKSAFRYLIIYAAICILLLHPRLGIKIDWNIGRLYLKGDRRMREGDCPGEIGKILPIVESLVPLIQKLRRS